MIHTLDAKGLRCPHPVLKIAVTATRLTVGDALDVTADCPTFEKDVRDYCTRARKTCLWIREDGGTYSCRIQF